MGGYDRLYKAIGSEPKIKYNKEFGTIGILAKGCLGEIYASDYYGDDLGRDVLQDMNLNHSHPAWDDLWEDWFGMFGM